MIDVFQGISSNSSEANFDIQCRTIDLEANTITFDNGVSAKHDLVVGADGIGSIVRGVIGINPTRRIADQQCLHCNVMTEDAVKAGLVDYSKNEALEYWGGQEGKWDKIVLSPCNGGKLLSYYCFYAREQGDSVNQAWGAEDRPVSELLDHYPQLDRQVFGHLGIGKDIQPWRLWIHDAYPYLNKQRVCLIGDAGHPMMPHQSQGACMAIEDAAASTAMSSKPSLPTTKCACLAPQECSPPPPKPLTTSTSASGSQITRTFRSTRSRIRRMC
jgi:salicylate hydroxylase